MVRTPGDDRVYQLADVPLVIVLLGESVSVQNVRYRKMWNSLMIIPPLFPLGPQTLLEHQDENCLLRTKCGSLSKIRITPQWNLNKNVLAKHATIATSPISGRDAFQTQLLLPCRAPLAHPSASLHGLESRALSEAFSTIPAECLCPNQQSINTCT